MRYYRVGNKERKIFGLWQKIASSLCDKCVSLGKHVSRIRREEPKKFARSLTSICCVAALSATAIGYMSYMNSLDVSLSLYADGRYIGTVESREEAQLSYLKVCRDISKKAIADTTEECELSYKFVRGKKAESTLDPDKLYNSLYELELSHYTDCTGLFVDGAFAAAGNDAEQLAEAYKDFGVTTKQVLVPSELLLSKNEIVTLLGDIIDDEEDEISDKILFDATLDADKSFAPSMNYQNDNVKNEGGESKSDEEQGSYSEDSYVSEVEYVIPYDTIYEDSSDIYIGSYELKQNGVDGLGKAVYTITNLQGVEISREKTSDTVLSNPVSKIILRGTKPLPKGTTTGTFAFPLKDFVYTDLYGSRSLNGNYSYHYGVDMYAPKGTPIYASDGGRVIYAGVHRSFGKCVIIEHENGYQTLYAHMSALSASEGEKVDKGEKIGEVGATGMAYGYHLHFEIHLNGERLDPQKFLPY